MYEPYNLVEWPFLLRLFHGKQTSLQISREMLKMINKNSKIKMLFVFSLARNPSHFPYWCYKVLFFKIPKETVYSVVLLSCVSSCSLIRSLHPSKIFSSSSTLLFCADRREYSCSGGNFSLRVNISNWSNGINFRANIPELNFILPCMSRLHIPQNQCEDIFILQDFTPFSWQYFLPIFKPVNGGERISSNGTGYKDILPRSCRH